MGNWRKLLIRVHVLIAGFFLPVGVMFLITGAFYTFSLSGNYNTRTYDLTLQQPISPDLAALVTLATTELQNRQIGLPTGKAGIRKVGSSWQLEWTGANRDVLLAPAADPNMVKLTVRDTTPYRRLVQLHKAKGSLAFKLYAAAWATGLLILFVSGLALAWTIPSARRWAIGSLAAGLLVFFILAALG